MDSRKDGDRSRMDTSASEVISLRSSMFRPHDVSSAYPPSIYSIPQSNVTVVDVEPSPVMFPTNPKAALIVSIVFTFLCCFVCSIPAIVLSKKAMDLENEGEKSMARRMTNSIAFCLVLSAMCGIIFWAGMGIMYDSMLKWKDHNLLGQ